MLQMHEILKSLHGAVYFSTLDLRSAYWKVDVDPESIHKTAFATQNNQYEFLRFPFGLKNSAATFQMLINTVLAELLGKICLVHIDDTIVYSNILLTHLHSNSSHEVRGLTLNLKKCQICHPWAM